MSSSSSSSSSSLLAHAAVLGSASAHNNNGNNTMPRIISRRSSASTYLHCKGAGKADVSAKIMMKKKKRHSIRSHYRLVKGVSAHEVMNPRCRTTMEDVHCSLVPFYISQSEAENEAEEGASKAYVWSS